MTAIDDAIDAMPAAARVSVADRIEDGAQAMYLRPWRIAETILGSHVWPVDGMSLGDLLAKGRRLDATMTRQGEAGQWWYDANLHLAVKQACRAVEIIAVEGDRLPQARRAA